MKQIAIYAKKLYKPDLLILEALLSGIQKKGWTAVLETELAQMLQSKYQYNNIEYTFESYQDLKNGFDLLISLGGDGTFLKSVSFIRDSGVPILGINTGRLGFLSNIAKTQIDQTLERFEKGQFEFQKRSLLRVETDEQLFGDENFALNELTLQKKIRPRWSKCMPISMTNI